MPSFVLADPTQLAINRNPSPLPVLAQVRQAISSNPVLTQWISSFVQETSIPSVADNSLIITTTFTQVFYVLVNDKRYSLGEFSFTPPTIVIPLNATQATQNLFYQVKVIGERSASSITTAQTNIVPKPYPPLLRQQNWTGQISLNRSIESHPSGSIELIGNKFQEAALLSLFRNGQEISIWGLPMIVSSLQISRLSEKKYPTGTIYVQISLQGKYAEQGDRSRLDKLIFIKNHLGKTRSIRLSEIARLSGVRYYGKDAVVSFPTDTPAETTVTLRQILQEFAPHLEGFLYWSNGAGVEIRSILQTPIHVIPASSVKDDRINYSYSGYGALVDGVQLSEEYRNRSFTLDITLTDGNSRIEKTWEFVNAEDWFDCTQYPKLKDDPTFFGVNELSTAANCFDSGGVTKTARKKTTINGQEISVEEWIFGYMFLTKETHSFYKTEETAKYSFKVNDSPVNTPQSYWKLIEHTESLSGYANEPLYPKKWKGYLMLKQKTGTRFVRFKQESEHETCDLWKELLDKSVSGISSEDEALIRDKISCYEWFKVGVKEETRYGLRPLSDFYSDIESSPCDPNQDWIEPVFAQIIERTSNDYFSRPDPESTKKEIKPDLVTGKKVKEKTEIVIIVPESPTALLQKPEKYKEIIYNSNIEGQNFKHAIRVESVTEMSDRPQIHTRLIPYQPESPTIHRQAEATKFTYILNSIGSETYRDDPTYSSISFPRLVDIVGEEHITVDNVKTVLSQLASKQLSFSNSKSALTVTLSIVWRNDLNEGDMVLWDNNLWLILGIDVTQQIQQYRGEPLLTCDQVQLKLGKVLTVPVTITTREKGKTSC